jgi:hypothetical protein
LDVGFDLLSCAVLRSVVDVNDVVVLVVLLQDGVQVAQVLVLVLVAGDDYAEWDFVVVAYSVLQLVLLALLLDDFLDLIDRLLHR